MITDEVEFYINYSFTDTLVDDIKQSFYLFDLFQLPDYEMDFTNVLSNMSNISPDQTRDTFINVLNIKLDYIIVEHKFRLVEGISINKKNIILSGLHLLQDLESYSDIMDMLNNDLDDDEMLSELLSQLTELKSTEILSMLDSVDNSLINNIREYATSKIDNNRSLSKRNYLSTSDLNNLKLFKEYCKDILTLGLLFVNNGIIVGLNFKDYVPYIPHEVFTEEADNKLLAYHIYSIMLITSDYNNNPLKGFRDNSDVFVNSINKVTNIDTEINKLIVDFEKFKINKGLGVKHE